MKNPEKEYQLWWHTGEGFSYYEFDSEDEMAAFIQGGGCNGMTFTVTRLLHFYVDLRSCKKQVRE